MDVLEWSKGAKPGDVVTYHRGASGPRREVGDAARAAHHMDLVFLAQRRLPGGHGFAYQATRISRETAWRLGLVQSELGTQAPALVPA